eukprot:8042457-Alexandrium_andersonii.AAC.1
MSVQVMWRAVAGPCQADQAASCSTRARRGPSQVDTIQNVVGRLPAWFLLDQARVIADDLRRQW